MYQFLHNYCATPHCTKGVSPATALFGRPSRVKLPNHVVAPSGESHDPVTMRKRDAQQKLKIKSQAELRRTIKDCDIQVGDTVLVRQPKREKLSTPYHPTPLAITKKHYSILTAESADQQVTHNSSHFKKLLADDCIAFRTSQSLEGGAIDQDNESSTASHNPVSAQEFPTSSVDPGGNAEVLSEPVG